MVAAEDAHHRPTGWRAKIASGQRAFLPRPPADGFSGWLERQGRIEAAARTGFFLVPAGLMLGIALYYAVGWRPPVAVATAFAVPLLFAAFHQSGRGAAGSACLFAGFTAAGMALAGAELGRTTTTIFSGEATVRITGTVEGRERDARGRLRYRLAITGTDRPLLSRPPQRAEILVSSAHTPLPIGGRYAGLVRLRAPSGPAFPGGYDFSFGAFFGGLGAQGFALGAPEAQPPEEAPGQAAPDARAPEPRTVGERLLSLRLSMSERIRAVLPGPEGAVAAALITGDRAGIPEEIDLWLRTTGLSHVLSISGLHMALVAGFAMALVRAGLAAIPAVALRWPIKKIAAVAGLAAVTFYILLSGRNVAADRAYIMLAIMLAAILFDRPAITLRNVGLAAILVLVSAPHALLTASFQMSFGATAALVGVYGAYARARARQAASAPKPRPALRLLLFLAGLGASSLIAGTATAPFAAYHFQRVAPFGLFANLLALPLFSAWIMPLALVAVLAMPLGLDALFLQLMGHGLTLVFTIAHVLHDRLPDAPTGLMTARGLVMLSVALMLACFLRSGLRWLALPLAALGLALAPDRSPPPELLVFEDGRALALIGDDGTLTPLQPRPNGFVLGQWQRAFPAAGAVEGAALRFTCEQLPPAPDRPSAAGVSAAKLPAVVDTAVAAAGAAEAAAVAGPAAGAVADPAGFGPGVAPPAAKTRAPRAQAFCRATTRSGLRLAWTDDYRALGRACDSADIAIVARAVLLTACRSGAVLVTLRTLRRTGSLDISRSAETGRAAVTASIGGVPEPWQAHRLAPWPEAWRRNAR